MRTQAAAVPSPGAGFELVDVDLDGPRSGEVLVRILATGLCHTDLSARDTLPAAMFPRVFGHEGASALPLDRLVTPYPFEDINRAAADVLAGSVVKPVLVW